MIDLLIIGGGIVGSWIALLAARSGISVAVADQSDRPGDSTSGRNSGVLHAGIYYKPGSKKAHHCIQGYALTLEYLNRRNIPHLVCGKLITTGDQTSADVDSRLESILSNARSIGARDLEIVSLSNYPGVRGKRAILSPHTGVCDAAAYLNAVQREAQEYGTMWLPGRKMVAFEHGAVLEDASGNREFVEARSYVNAAGLQSDEVAMMTGRHEFTIVPVRGEYYRLRKPHGINMLIYPLPDPDSTALGVHYTFHPGGDAYAGPNAIPADHKEDYRIIQSAKDFAESLGRILEGYTVKDFNPGYAGLRPRLKIHGKDYGDFYVEKEGPWVHLLGIESPGLTSAASLSREVMELLGIALNTD